MIFAILSLIRLKFRRWRLSALLWLVPTEPESEQVRVMRRWMDEGKNE